MFTYSGNNIRMVEGDHGIGLTIIVKGAEFSDNDVIRITFKSKVNDETPILVKEYTPVRNTMELMFTEAESALLPVGCYVYSMDWYRGDELMCNVTPLAYFKVLDKA